MSGLLPCPSQVRGAHTVGVVRGSQDTWVQCSCGFAGPRRSSDEDAVEAWTAGRSSRGTGGGLAADEIERAVEAQQRAINLLSGMGGYDGTVAALIGPNRLAAALRSSSTTGEGM